MEYHPLHSTVTTALPLTSHSSTLRNKHTSLHSVRNQISETTTTLNFHKKKAKLNPSTEERGVLHNPLEEKWKKEGSESLFPLSKHLSLEVPREREGDL